MLQRLFDYLFGTRLDPAGACAWCKKPIGEVAHAPIPLCDGCFHPAFRSGSPDIPGTPSHRLMTEFEREAHRWISRQMSLPTASSMAADGAEMYREAMALRHRAMNAVLAGDRVKWRDLEVRANDLVARATRLEAEMPQHLRAIGDGFQQ